MSEQKIVAGIDTGVKTGVAIWNCTEQRFELIKTWSIIEAMHNSLLLYRNGGQLHKIYFEDARLRGGDPNSKKFQGVGSVKRDSKIWQEFCEYHKIPFEAVKPIKGNTKWDVPYFKRLTGWKKRTSQHARDAAALVFGMK